MFRLDPKLEADTIFVKTLALSEVLLMNDSRFPWLILVPRRENSCEIFELNIQDQTVLWQEILHVSSAMKQYFQADKMNIATLGNVVGQLHIHIIARNINDAAWPKPVWGQGTMTSYSQENVERLLQNLLLHL